MSKKSPSQENSGSGGSIHYDDETSSGLPHRLSPSARGRKKIKFGVKSYLHHFYEDCAGIGLYDDDEAEDSLDLKPKSGRRCKLLCRIGFTISIILICIGIIFLLVGFLIQPKHTRYIAGNHTFTNQDNVNFNKFLVYSRWAGAFTFCFGGILLSVCIVLLGFGKLNHKSDMVERKIFEDRLHRRSKLEKAQGYSGTDEYGNLVQYGTCGSTTMPTTTLTTSLPVPTSLREVTPVQPSEEPR